MANKYLDGAGLDHMWDKIKTYLTSNYAAKSHTHTIAQITNLQTTLNGKANSSHTHTASQITDLSSSGFLKANSNLGTLSWTSSSPAGYRINIPNNIVNQITFISDFERDTSQSWNIYLPSGGVYLVYKLRIQGGLSGGDHLTVGKFSGGSSVDIGGTEVNGFFVIRIS